MEIVTYIMAKLAVARAKLSNDERGVTALEYGLIAALIAVAIIAAVTLLGTSLQALFTALAGAIAAATAGI